MSRSKFLLERFLRSDKTERMGYLVEVDTWPQRVIFPQPDKASPFYYNGKGSPDVSPEMQPPETAAGGQEEFNFAAENESQKAS